MKDSYNYYIIKVPFAYKLIVEINYLGVSRYLVFGYVENPRWGHKKKSSKCSINSFLNIRRNFIKQSMTRPTFLLYYPNIIKSGITSWKTLEKIFPDAEKYYVELRDRSS